MKLWPLAFLLLASTAGAAGPLYHHENPSDDLEFRNVYNDIRSPKISTGTAQALTVVGLTISTMTASSATITAATINTLTVSTINGVTGRFLQIASTNTVNNQKTSTSGSYVNTGLTRSFTPTSSTSKILIWVAQSFGVSGTAGTVCTMRVKRDSTDLSTMPGDQTAFVNTSTSEGDSIISLLAVDTPGDTSAHTYSTTFSRFSGTGTCIVNSTVGTNTASGGAMIIAEVSQ